MFYRFVVAILTFVILSGGSVASVVYSNHQGFASRWAFGSNNYSPEMADLIQLAGTDRTLQSVTMWLHCSDGYEDGGEVDAIFRVRAYNSATGLPGAVLAEATAHIVYAPFQREFRTTLQMSAVPLPDQVVVGAELLNGTDQTYGVVAAQPVTVGSSNSEHWFFNNNGWLNMHGGGNGLGNLGIELHAVPEPASTLVVSLGLAAMCRKRGRRRLPEAN